MLSTKQEFVTAEDKERLRKWLTDPGAKLFYKIVNSQLHENQISATREFCDDRDSHEQDGRILMSKSAHYRHTLEVMNQFSDPNAKLYTVKIVEEI